MATNNRFVVKNGLEARASSIFTGDLNVDSGTFFVDATNNRVGIGTTTPQDAVQVQGDIRLRADIPEIKFRSSGDVNQYYIGANVSDTIDGGFIIGKGSGISGGTERFRIDYLGNIGIGTGTVSARLHISTGTLPTSLGTLPTDTRIISDAHTGDNFFTFRNTANNSTYAGLVFQDDNVGGYVSYRNAGGTSTFPDSMIYGAYSDHVFQTGTSNTIAGKTEVVRIKQNGRVGIGTSDPQSILHLQTISGDTKLIIESDADDNAEGDNSFIIFRGDGGIEQSVIKNGNFTGGNDNQLIFYNSSGVGGGIIFATGTIAGYSNALERLRITPSGNVGIGNTNPTAKLDVVGDANISTNLTVGGNLTVNGTTTTVNSTVTTLDDPILTLGGDTSVVEVTKDRGVEFKWNGTTLTITNYIGNGTTTVTGTVASTTGYAAGDVITISGATGTEQTKLNGTWQIASVPNSTTFTFVVSSSVVAGTYTSGLGTTIKSKNGFFGFDQSSGRFTFIPQSNQSSEVYSGTLGDIEVGSIIATNLTIDTSTLYVDSTNDRVGIATTTPLTRLDVRGDVFTGSNAYYASNLYYDNIAASWKYAANGSGGALKLASTSNCYEFIIAATNSSGAGATASPSVPMRLFPDGNLVINNTSTTGTATQQLQVYSGAYIQGNVGIGTTSPSYKTHIVGTNNILALESTVATDRSTMLLLTNGSDWEVGARGSTNAIPNAFYIYDLTSTSYRQVITSTGNVGIGTTDPKTKLEVSGAVGIGTAIDIVPYDTLNSGTLSFEGSAGQLFSITNNLTTGSIFSVNDVSGIPSIDVDASGTIQIAPFSGNVGIGTTVPGAKLEVYGTSRFGGTVSAGRRVDIATDGLVTIAYGNNTNASALTLDNTSDISSTTNNGSNVLWRFGTSTTTTAINAGRISVLKEQQWTTTASTQDAYMAFDLATDGTIGEKVRITSAGNVGVGITNPSEKLQITGNYILVKNSADSAGGLVVDTGSTATQISQILLRDRTTDRFTIRKTSSNNFDIYNSVLGTPGSSITILGSSNNVGIGSTATNPLSALSIPSTGSAPTVTIPDPTNPRYSVGFGSINVSGVGQRLDFFAGDSTSNTSNLTSSHIRMSLIATGSVGIGTTDPSARMHIGPVNGNTTPHIYIASNTNAYGWRIDTHDFTGGSVPLRIWRRVNGTDTESITVLNATGNVGIGTTNPATKLAVNGSITESTDGTNYWNVVTQQDIGYNANQIPLNQYLGQLAFLDDYHPSGLRRDGGGIDDVFVNSSGNVGIGTTTISDKLHVFGGRIRVDTSTAGSLQFWSGTGFYGGIGILADMGGTGTDIAVRADTSRSLIFLTGGANERVRITSTGLVGIGTTNPAVRLHVTATGTASTGLAIADFRSSADNQRITIVDETSTGSKPPGIKSPTAAFGLGLYAPGGPVIFYTEAGETEKVRITATGNVGIGTTDPGTNKLQVQGDINITGITNVKQVTETVVNAYTTSLTPSGGTLTIDTSAGTIYLGDLSAPVTIWAFTNVPTTSSKAISVTVIIDGDTADTYGDACSVNGTSVTNGVLWAGGSAPTPTTNFDIISFNIIRDSGGTVRVFGSASLNFS